MFRVSGGLERDSTAQQLMADSYHRTFFLKGLAGRLEAMLWTVPVAHPHLAALVCHPHPLYGGTMHNKVVYRTALAIHRHHVPVLRFNFRGAGLSDGAHDLGRGEQDDVRAALDYLAKEFPGRPVLLAGFSFGSWVGLQVASEDARVSALMGLGLPVDSSDWAFLRGCIKSKLIIQGANDPFGSLANVEALFATIPEPKRLVIIEGADHFFAGKLDEVSAAINAWLKEWYPGIGRSAAP
jgi:uncharacterized protein